MPQQGAAYKGALLPKAAPGAAPAKPPGLSRSAGVGKVSFKALPADTTVNGLPRLGTQLRTETKQAAAKLPKPSGGGGGGVLGTIEAGPQLAAAAISDIPKIPGAIVSDVPKELHGEGFVEGGIKSAARTFGTVETKGYENLLGSKGVGGSIAKTIGDGLREIPELPAQVLPTLYESGRAVVDAHMGNNRPLESLTKGFEKESVVAHLAKGELGQAVSTLKNRPVSSGLEVSGVGGAADRLAGAAARSGALGEDMASKAALAEPGSTDLSRQPQDLLGNAREPLPPKSKRLSTALRQDAHDRTVRPGETVKEQIKGQGLGQRLTRHLDSKNGDIRSIQKHNVNEAVHTRMEAVAGKRIPGTSVTTPIAGHGAVNLFTRGILADPKVADHITGQPLYRTQLKDLTEYHATPVDGETLQEKALRESNVAHAQALLDDQRFQRDPQKAYMAAGKYAKDMKTLEPAVKDATGLSDESARAAKLTDPFMFHWRDQDPLVSEGENGTEFSVENKNVTAHQNAAKAHGEAESELAAAIRARAAGEPELPTHTYDPTPAGINGRSFYHGTRTQGLSAEGINPAQGAPNSLFGPGFYTTDSQKIADSYGSNKGRGTGTPPVTYRGQFKVKSVLDLHAPADRRFVDALKSSAENIETHMAHGGYESPHRLSEAIEIAAAKPGATSADIYKVFKAGLGDISHDKQIPRYEFHEPLEVLQENLAKHWDALTHKGGIRHPERPSTHQVVISLKPGVLRDVSEVPRLGEPRSVGGRSVSVDAQARVDAAKERADSTGEEMTKAGKSVIPGAVQRRNIPIEQVERQLKDEHGVDPDHVGFVSNRPYINKDAQYYKNGQDPARAGYYPQKFRSGNAFKRGQYDPSHEALVTQHVANQGIVDQVHAARMQVKDYFLTREHVAKLLEEKDPKSPLIQDLRSGKSTYFGSGQGTSAWTKAQQAAAEIRQAHPDLRLVPGRIAAPYAGKDYLGKLSQDAHDVLDPNRIDDERGGNLADAFPKDEEIQHTAGSVGLVHADVAKHMDAYSKQQGSAFGKLLRAPANFWRVSNIALSPKHPIGIAQELGIRAAVNNIGPMSLLREHRMSNLWERALEDPGFLKDNPGVENQYALMRSKTEGTESKQALQLQEHITSKDVGSASRSGALLRAGQNVADHPIVGAPLRAAQHVLKAYSTITKDILRFQNKVLGGPALKAGLGKAVNDEVKRLTGSSIPLIHEMDDRTKEVILGQVTNPNALAATGRKLIEYYGDWTKASPKTKNILAVAPFWNWFANSLRFVYQTLPMNHPIKTALVTTLEGATKAQRQAIGQGAGSFEKLEPEQQGGIPIGHGYTSTPQHYTPFGAVNEPLATFTGLWLPEIQDAYKAATGTNPFGETLENGSKEPITSEKERARYAALGLLESFLPPLRTVATALSGGKSRQGTETYGATKEDPVGKALGISPGIWKAIEPLRIAQERTETGVRESQKGGVRAPRELAVGKELKGGRELKAGKELQ